MTATTSTEQAIDYLTNPTDDTIGLPGADLRVGDSFRNPRLPFYAPFILVESIEVTPQANLFINDEILIGFDQWLTVLKA